MKAIPALTLMVLSFLYFGCTSANEIDTHKWFLITKEFGPAEIMTTIDKMTIAMYRFINEEGGSPLRIQVKGFENRSSEKIDLTLITDQILTRLKSNKAEIIDRRYLENVEILYEKTGRIYSQFNDVPIGKLRSPNFYLSGDIRDNVQVVDGKSIQYLVITMRLYCLKTGVVEWQEQQQFYKVTTLP